MAGARSERENPPQITLTQISARRTEAAEWWSVGWLVENRGTDSLTLESVRLPHGQFKSGEERFEPALVLPPGEKTEVTTPVRCNEPAGLVTENGFVIFRVIWLSERWRIFVRMRVNVTHDGAPESETESITTQKVGFSGVDS
jgi:hypothetical protein